MRPRSESTSLRREICYVHKLYVCMYHETLTEPDIRHLYYVGCMCTYVYVMSADLHDTCVCILNSESRSKKKVQTAKQTHPGRPINSINPPSESEFVTRIMVSAPSGTSTLCAVPVHGTCTFAVSWERRTRGILYGTRHPSIRPHTLSRLSCQIIISLQTFIYIGN